MIASQIAAARLEAGAGHSRCPATRATARVADAATILTQAGRAAAGPGPRRRRSRTVRATAWAVAEVAAASARPPWPKGRARASATAVSRAIDAVATFTGVRVSPRA